MYWERLREKSPGEVSNQTLVAYEDGEYKLQILKKSYTINPQTETVNGIAPGYFFQAFILQYLLSDPLLPERVWISVQELPGGPLFFRGPHRLPTDRISKAYGNDAEGFVRRGLELGGRSDSASKFAIKLNILPLVSVCLLLWPGNVEFPAEARMLFDSAATFLPKDALWALSCWTIEKFISN